MSALKQNLGITSECFGMSRADYLEHIASLVAGPLADQVFEPLLV